MHLDLDRPARSRPVRLSGTCLHHRHNLVSFSPMLVTSRAKGPQGGSSATQTMTSRLPTLPEEETSAPKKTAAGPVAALREAADGKDDTAEV